MGVENYHINPDYAFTVGQPNEGKAEQKPKQRGKKIKKALRVGVALGAAGIASAGGAQAGEKGWIIQSLGHDVASVVVENKRENTRRQESTDRRKESEEMEKTRRQESTDQRAVQEKVSDNNTDMENNRINAQKDVEIEKSRNETAARVVENAAKEGLSEVDVSKAEGGKVKVNLKRDAGKQLRDIVGN
jgi:hypothetical protein